jgi:hypothetical protein
MAMKSKVTALIAGLGLLIVGAAATQAHAGGYGSSGSCGCHQHHHKPQKNQQNVNVKQNVDVYVNVVTKSNSTSSSSAMSSASANATAAATAMSRFLSFGQQATGGGGGAASFVTPGPVSVLDLNTSTEDRSSYEATRTRIEKVVIQAFCFDDKDVPHPASQVFADRDVAESYEGEVYRCIAGTHMQVTIAPWADKVSFEGGKTLACLKGEALYHVPGKDGGRLECRPQIPARDCNERSLLRRFGAGVKVLTLIMTEKYTATREETREGGASAMTLDGGVGGFVN